MKIINKTQWATRDLRRVFAAVLVRWNKIDDRKVSSRRLNNVEIVNTRWRGPSGCAYVGSGTMTIRLPKPEHGPLDVFKVGFLFEHELAHCAGYGHKRMGPLNHWTIAHSGRYDYLDGMTIERAEPKAPKPKPDRKIVNYQRAVAALKRWESKRKRAENAAKKYRAKVRRYERGLEADGRLAALKDKGA